MSSTKERLSASLSQKAIAKFLPTNKTSPQSTEKEKICIEKR
jgi:hypothetical protein